MVANRKVTGKASSIPVGIGAGAAISMTITVGLAALAANLILNEKMEQIHIGYAAFIILLLSSTAGSASAVWMVKHQKLAVSMITGGVYYLLLLCCTALFFGGQYQGMGVTLLVVLAGSGCVAIFGLRERKSSIKRRNKMRFR